MIGGPIGWPIGGVINSEYSIDADVGAFTLAGQDVALLATRTMPVGAGAFAFTGQDVALLKGFQVNADVGSFLLTGQDAALTYYALRPEAGAFVVTGHAVTLTKSWLDLMAGVGTFVVSGGTTAVDLLFERRRVTISATGGTRISGLMGGATRLFGRKGGGTRITGRYS